ncbi:MAG: NAD(+)/NADH kinase [Candidatus Zixiibacteriota bacterium]
MTQLDAQPKRIGIVVNVLRPEARPLVASIGDWADKHEWTVSGTYEIDMTKSPDFSGFPKGTISRDIDLLLALGGDGTMLTSVRSVAEQGTPVLGVNLGSLGFLTVVPLDKCLESLDRVARGDYHIEERLLLEVTEPGSGEDRWTALNDIVLMKAGMARMASVTISCNGEYLTTMAGDGVIVATPTGSTAYSLSAGGPIVIPTMNGFILTPVSPHTLAQRPMVFDSETTIEIKLEALVGEAMLTADGQLARYLEEGATVRVRPASHRARLLGFSDRSFFRILREKLHWGIGPSLGPEWTSDKPHQ